MGRIMTAVIVLACLVVSGFAAEHSLGMQADMVGQGLTYRILTNSGWGAQIVARGRYDLSGETYNLGGEFTLLKRFNSDKRTQIFLGLTGGAWQFNEYYREVWLDSVGNYHEQQRLHSQSGISFAGLVGIELLVFELSETTGVSITPHFQFGYYTMPDRAYYLDREYEDIDDYEPERFISPGAGIGLYYYF